MEKTMLTVKEAAAIMRISTSSMYQLIREDKAPTLPSASVGLFLPLVFTSGLIPS